MCIVRQIMDIIPNDYTYLYRIVVHTSIKMFIMLRDENNSVQLYNVLIRQFFFCSINKCGDIIGEVDSRISTEDDRCYI